MKELLMRWWKLEPERCKWSDDSYRESFHVLYKGDIEEVWIEGGEFDEAYIQAAVQEAIEAREWDWYKPYYGPGAEVQVGFGDKIYAVDSDKGFVFNLLDAYLQALEAQ